MKKEGLVSGELMFDSPLISVRTRSSLWLILTENCYQSVIATTHHRTIIQSIFQMRKISSEQENKNISHCYIDKKSNICDCKRISSCVDTPLSSGFFPQDWLNPIDSTVPVLQSKHMVLWHGLHQRSSSYAGHLK